MHWRIQILSVNFKSTSPSSTHSGDLVLPGRDCFGGLLMLLKNQRSYKKRILRSAEIIVAQTHTCYLSQLVPVLLSFRVTPQKGLQISLLITTALVEFQSSIMLAPESLYALKLISCWNNPALMASNALLILQLTAFLPSFAFNGSHAALFLLLPVELSERFGD